MTLTNNVVDGQIITAAWGNTIRDRTIQQFTNLAELNTWAAPDGCTARTLDTGQVYLRQAGAWTLPAPAIVYRLIDSTNYESPDIGTNPWGVTSTNVAMVAGRVYRIECFASVISRATTGIQAGVFTVKIAGTTVNTKDVFMSTLYNVALSGDMTYSHRATATASTQVAYMLAQEWYGATYVRLTRGAGNPNGMVITDLGASAF